jgi:hypothetical protein
MVASFEIIHQNHAFTKPKNSLAASQDGGMQFALCFQSKSAQRKFLPKEFLPKGCYPTILCLAWDDYS